MIDVETHKQIRVNTEGDAGPYLLVPLDQLEDVRNVLQRNQIRFDVDEDAIQIDGKAFIAIVDFGLGADPLRIQAVLDAA